MTPICAEYVCAVLEAMGSGDTIRKALALVAERAPEREIGDVDELIRALYDMGEDLIPYRLRCRIVELRKGESADAIAGLYMLIKLLPEDAYMSFGFAVKCAQARCGKHSNPDKLIRDMDFKEEGFRFGQSWQFWGDRSPDAIKAAKAGFIAALLHAANLGDEPEYPNPIA